MIELLEKPYTVYFAKTHMPMTVVAPNPEGALLEASKRTYGTAYWDKHEMKVGQGHILFGDFYIYTRGV